MTPHVSPGIFHLHIDGSYASEELDIFLKSRFGFVNGDFCGHPEGYRHFEPQYHRIFKTTTRDHFTTVWEEVEKEARKTGFIGYMEGEFIRSDEVIACNSKFDNSINVPFTLERRRLFGAFLADESFREAELHLVMDRDQSDPCLIKKLLDAGLYGAYIPKGDHIAIVLTAQGYITDIDILVDAVRYYVLEAGGAARCTLKNERAIRYAMFGIDHTGLPEIVDVIKWQSTT